MKLPNYVQEVLGKLESAGYEAWCVGGCVRDMLLNREPGDWDVTTNALPEETLALFGRLALPTGLRHGTVTVRCAEGAVEVTTYRVDGDYYDHRRPDFVTFTASLEEDLARRDFTVNAIAMDLRGTLCDPFGGREDLERNFLRCVGEPDKRFDEDALRMLRGLRFAAVLGLHIEPATAESIHRNCGFLREIAPERIQVELFKLLVGESAAEVLREFPDVIGVFWPEILPMVGFDQRNHHHCYDVWEHTLHALEATPKDLVLRCVMLLHDLGKPRTFSLGADGEGHFFGHPNVSRDLADDMLRRLKCSNEFRETVVLLVEWHDRDIPRTEKSVRRAMRVLGVENFRRLMIIKRSDNKGQAPKYWGRQDEISQLERFLNEILEQDACFSMKQLAVNGRDLTALGFSGQAVGEMLGYLLEQVMENAVPNQRETLLEYARKTEENPTVTRLWSMYHREFPPFLREFAEMPQMQRLKQVGMNCGCEYTGFPRFRGLKPYSRYDHSIGVALIIWHFTGDIQQTLAGLFHDITTPVFAHVVDFLNGDHLRQESTEAGMEEFLWSAGEIRSRLRKYGLTPMQVSDYHRFPVADNNAPALSADRLEYTLGNLLNYGLADVKELRRFYTDLVVGTDEAGRPELVFQTPEIAAEFAKASLKTSAIYVADEDRFAMEALAHLLRSAITDGVLTREDLWTTEQDVIGKLVSVPAYAARWKAFCGYSAILCGETPEDDGFWVQVEAKKRWIDPIARELGRVSSWNREVREAQEAFLAQTFSAWLSAE